MFLGLSIMSSAIGNPVAVDIYELKDKNRELGIEQVIKSNLFSKINDVSSLNFGITISNYWLKIVVKNTVPDATYKLIISCIVLDTVEIYEQKDGNLKKELIGEAIPSDERFLNYYFKPSDEETILYLKITGDGQPVALPLSIIRSDKGESQQFAKF